MVGRRTVYWEPAGGEGRVRRGRSGSGGGVVETPSDEPTYAGSNLLYAGNAANAEYTDLTAMGATPMGSSARFIVSPSPVSVEGAGVVDTLRSRVTTGKDGSGKAFGLIYPTTAGQQGCKFWLNYVTSVPTLSEVRASWYQRFTGSIATTAAIKNVHVLMDGVNGGAQPQFSTHDASPSGLSAKHTYVQFYDQGYTDGVAPTGNQGTQPLGPYWQDMFDSGWHHVTIAYKPHASSGNKNGLAQMWMDGVKVIDVRQATVGVTPTGGTKPWCAQGQVDNMTVNTAYGDSGCILMLGGTQTATFGQPDWGIDFNIGNGTPGGDTFTVWYV
jgi:hypothetical protein